MQGIDRHRINEIILRESAGSLYLEQQRKRDDKVNARIDRLREKLQTTPQLSKLELQDIETRLQQHLSQRPHRSTSVVVDMDMFFMACELQERPEIPADQPCCVGGNMISTSNYAARRFGVRSAMAGWIGDKLVSELSNGRYKLLHVKSNFQLYKRKSAMVKDVLQEYDPNMKMYSLDEAYLDIGLYMAWKLERPDWDHVRVRQAMAKQQQEKDNSGGEDGNDTDRTVGDTETDAVALDLDESGMGDAALLSPSTSFMNVLHRYSSQECLDVASSIVEAMRRDVCIATGGLTCSAGIAANTMLAKIASDVNKPNGQKLVEPTHDAITSFLYPLPIRKVSGIGRVAEKILNAFDIQTVGDLYAKRGMLPLLFQPASTNFLLSTCVGCKGSRASDEDEDEEHDTDNHDDAHGHQKGISRERTFLSGRPWTEVLSRLEDIGRLLSKDMRKKQLFARTITVKVKLHTFDCLSKSKSMSYGVLLQGGDEIVAQALELLRDVRSEHTAGQKKTKQQPFSVRLLGIRCSNLTKNRPTTPPLDQFLVKKTARSLTNTRSPVAADSSTNVSPTRSIPSHRAVPPSAAGTKKPIHPAFTTLTTDGRTKRSRSSSSAHTADTAIESMAMAESVACPLCGKSFPISANAALNQHVDQCLSGDSTTIRRSSRDCQRRQDKRTKLITDYY